MNSVMNQTELIDWLVHHLDCTDCPLYVRCMQDRPRTCREYLSDSFRASAVAEQAVQNHVGRIRKKYSELMKETDADKRRTLLNELTEMKRELRKVKEYIG